MSSPPVLVMSRVAKTFRAGVPGCGATVAVLRAVSLTVRARDLMTVSGPGGAGKTTLLLCAAGMLRPDEGIVRWPSLPLVDGGIPRGVAYVADRPVGYGFLSVRESLAYAVTVRNLHERDSAPSLSHLLDVCALSARAGVRAGLLTDAERARLLVALALVSSPRLLLVDDLCVAADHSGSEAFAECLAAVAASGPAVLWASRAAVCPAEARAAYTMTFGRMLRSAASPVTPRSSFPAPPTLLSAHAPVQHADENDGGLRPG